MSFSDSPTISERGSPPFQTFTMPHLPPRQLHPAVRQHWTINLLSWIIECVQTHPVVLQPVPPQDQFPIQKAYHHFREFRIILLELGIIRDRVDSALRQVQEFPHDDLAALTRTWHQANNISYMDGFSRSGPALYEILQTTNCHEMDHTLMPFVCSQPRNMATLLFRHLSILVAAHALHRVARMILHLGLHPAVLPLRVPLQPDAQACLSLAGHAWTPRSRSQFHRVSSMKNLCPCYLAPRVFARKIIFAMRPLQTTSLYTDPTIQVPPTSYPWPLSCFSPLQAPGPNHTLLRVPLPLQLPWPYRRRQALLPLSIPLVNLLPSSTDLISDNFVTPILGQLFSQIQSASMCSRTSGRSS